MPHYKPSTRSIAPMNRRVLLDAIDATPARWRGDTGFPPLDRARTAASSPRNDLVSAPDALVDLTHRWTEKVKKMEVELRNKEENKEVSLGTSKANYMDPRITVAWCKRCDLEISRLFPKTLKDKFNWAMGVDGDWRFEAAEKSK